MEGVGQRENKDRQGVFAYINVSKAAAEAVWIGRKQSWHGGKDNRLDQRAQLLLSVDHELQHREDWELLDWEQGIDGTE